MNLDLLEVLGIRRAEGVHPPGRKRASDAAIERAPVPERVVLPLCQHIGAPAKPVVKSGDHVLVGQVVAEAGGACSAPIHATISGEVKPLATIVNPTSGIPIGAIVIEGDGEDKWIELQPADPDALSSDEVIARISTAGIVGLGGAAFPTHVKVNRPPGSPTIHTLIVNGAECEPYITSDDRLMLERPDKILAGVRILMKLLSVSKTHIGIEDNKPRAIEAMRKALGAADLPGTVVIEPLGAKYPMGAEKTMIKAILGVEVPEGGFPTDIGVVVQNVATLAAVADAVIDGRPLVERVVTVSGIVAHPRNLISRFGAPASWLIEQCGGMPAEADSIIFGGPMMGIAQASADAPLVKSTNCILVKRADTWAERSCIRCGRCVERCPMGLMPLMYVSHVRKSMIANLAVYHILNCVECGACTYDCPANIPIVSYIKVGKNELRALGRRN
ncbi:electron transport complex subunit RsxC [Candidatus Bipolaricaulota bacterium]|nr:electron transport complex subunit RsxC [Candidatus Bipolaricaulota bacterium]